MKYIPLQFKLITTKYIFILKMG